jgi:DNA integrity scanning protein DisA with diadenylate cyclase activity
MNAKQVSKNFADMVDLASKMRSATDADALLVMVNGPADWQLLKRRSRSYLVLVAGNDSQQMHDASEAGLPTVLLESDETPVLEQLSRALLASVADELLLPGSEVVALYSGFETGSIDSVSHIRLEDHLRRLTARDLRQLETSLPLETLRVVVDLALEIGREGREGKHVGTMFVVGDTRRVLAHSHSASFDPVRGYRRKQRDLKDPRVREAIKEIAMLDGAFLVGASGVVEKACRLVDAPHANITLSKGLGSRHWAAAAITKITNAVAVVVSETNGTVRLFQKGDVMLRVEPMRRAMKWKEFEYDPPPPTE